MVRERESAKHCKEKKSGKKRKRIEMRACTLMRRRRGKREGGSLGRSPESGPPRRKIQASCRRGMGGKRRQQYRHAGPGVPSVSLVKTVQVEGSGKGKRASSFSCRREPPVGRTVGPAIKKKLGFRHDCLQDRGFRIRKKSL